MRNNAQMTGMSSEWFNMVLSLLKRQHHIKVFWSERYIASGLDEFEIDLENGMEWNEEWCSHDRNDLWMSFYHSSVIPSILVHDDNILSFGVNPFIPWSFEHWNDVKWHSFEMTGMMLEWRFRSFPAHSPHSCHPRLLGNMGHSWFHPCHSGLFPSFGCHSKILNQCEFPRMT